MKYSEYKPLTELWLSSIPSHWSSRKLKYLFDERSEKGYPNEPLLVASQNMGVVPKNVYGSRTVEAMKDLHLLKLVKIGDFVISLRSFQGGIEYAYYQGIISPAYTIMIPRDQIIPGYFKYLAKSKLFIELLQLCVTGIREGQNIDYNKLKNHQIPVPSREEQDQIVRYLDWQVSKINKLIAAKKKQLNVLGEYRKSIITTAVSAGIGTHEQWKLTNITSTGKIPNNWSIRPFFKIAAVQANLVSPESYLDSYQVSPASIEKNTGRLLPCKTVKDSGVISSNHQFYKGQILYSKIRPLLNKVTIAPFDGLCSADMYPIETRLVSKYLVYYMLSNVFLSQLGIIRDRVKMPKINREELSEIMVLVPPQEEQNHIVEYLDKQCRKIDAVIDGFQKDITTLHDLRNRLISDVVTGQVDVRNIEIPDFEMVEETDAERTADEDDTAAAAEGQED